MRIPKSALNMTSPVLSNSVASSSSSSVSQTPNVSVGASTSSMFSATNSQGPIISQCDFDSLLDSTPSAPNDQSFTLYKSDIDENAVPPTTSSVIDIHLSDESLEMFNLCDSDIPHYPHSQSFSVSADNIVPGNAESDGISELMQELQKPPMCNRKRSRNSPNKNGTKSEHVTEDLNYSQPSSTSFTISIPSTSTTPAKTMYLPFTNRKPSLKSHELESRSLNSVSYEKTEEENEARSSRVRNALSDQDWSDLNLGYFIDQNIEEYLAKRGYLQRRLRLPKVIPKGIFASIISFETSISNCITFGPNYEANQIIDEIDRFWKFYLDLKEKNSQMSAELKQMLVPMLLYFYLECFVSGLVPVALRLYVEFSKKFLTEDATKESYDLLFSIATITSPDAFDDNELLQAFRQQEYRFVLSRPTFDIVQKFAVSSSSPVLIHLFSSRFTIQLKETTEIAEQYVDIPHQEVPKKRKIEEGSKAAEVIKRLRESPEADMPSLLVYLTNKRPISGAASSNMIAFGMANGDGIKVSFTSQRSLNKFKLEIESSTTTSSQEQTSPELVNILRGHSGSVYALGFHPTMRLLYSGGADCKMRVWDLTNMRRKERYKGHMLPITCLDIAESGNMIATGSLDKTARIWLPDRSDDVRMMAGHHFHITSVKFHPNEAYLATGSFDTTARLWSISDGSMVRVFTGFSEKITDIAIHETGKYLLAGGADPCIRVWDIGEGEIIAELPCPPNCTSLALNRNTLVASFQRSSTLRLWNLTSVLSLGCELLEIEPVKLTCIANSILKLQFENPMKLLVVGEEYSPAKNRTEEQEEDEAQDVQPVQSTFTAPQYSEKWWSEVENLLPELNSAGLENDIFDSKFKKLNQSQLF